MTLINFERLWQCCADIGIDAWQPELAALIAERLSDDAHGDFAQWRQTLDALKSLDASQTEEIRSLLLTLSPWRKGPFDVAGVRIDAEWQSNLKWARIADRLAPLADRNVLDVGCGNGYYALQMHAAGAHSIIGIDPTLLYVMQFLAVNHFAKSDNVFVLPLRLHELPPSKTFDTTFSMGVLYHQRSPIDHLRQLRDMTRAGGQLVLETIVLPGDEAFAKTPDDRYARMRNVWLLPSVAELTTWLDRCGYTDIDVIDVTATTVEEQRSTDWMTFESLAEALQPDNPRLTVEGWPAPQRATVLATAK